MGMSGDPWTLLDTFHRCYLARDCERARQES
jgi:hypothetical protein